MDKSDAQWKRLGRKRKRNRETERERERGKEEKNEKTSTMQLRVRAKRVSGRHPCSGGVLLAGFRGVEILCNV